MFLTVYLIYTILVLCGVWYCTGIYLIKEEIKDKEERPPNLKEFITLSLYMGPILIIMYVIFYIIWKTSSLLSK